MTELQKISLERDELRSQLEQVQSEAAVMRNALILIYNTHSFECGHNCTCSICQSISTTAGKEMLDRVHELEEGKVRAVAANDILDDLLKEQGDMIQQLQLDYSNLVSTNKVMSDKLTGQIQIYVGRIKIMKDALEKLAKFGNEPFLGSSKGNVIAQKALSLTQSKTLNP